MADGAWPNLTGKFKPHDDHHTHSTWLDSSEVNKVLQMGRRGHAMHGMDRVYLHVTDDIRQRLCDILEQLWHEAVAQCYKLAPRVSRAHSQQSPDKLEQGQPGKTD